ncbi:flavin-nucleotide-binding protein [Nemania sp. NC0429]|nr:flavin-nucleotide-binding protein [Nemania sp. NC0429]
MPSEELQYPTKPYSKVNRYDVRATYALETIHEIVNTCPVLQVSFTVPDSPFPMMLPMIGQMGSFARPSSDTGDVLELYLHGYVSSRLINLSRKGGSSSSGSGSGESGNGTGTGTEPRGLPVTVGASHIDGLVLALTPNSHSYNYRSAVLFGHAEVVTDVEEKLWAMELITNSVVRDRYRHTRVPPNQAEMQSTSVLRVAVAAGSAKLRSGMPSDDKGDLADAELLDRVWTGVVPVHYTLGEPIPGPYNKLEAPPAYLDEFVRESNQDARDAAVEAARRAPKPKAKAEQED